MSGPDAKLLEKLQSVRELPTLPETLQSVLSIITDPGSSGRDLAEVIERDQSLTAKILRMVNSAFYGFFRQITSVRDAVVILGYNEVRILALTISVFDAFEVSSSGWKRGLFWEHSLAVGAATESLAKRAKIDLKEAFVAGLLHDLGKVALDHILGTKWYNLVIRAQEEKVPLNELEMKELGVDHGDVGAWLGDKWHFPEGIVGSMQYHHRPEELKHQPRICSAVRIANTIVKSKGIGSGGNNFVESREPSTLARLKLEDCTFEEIEGMVSEDLKSYKAAVHYADST